MLKKIIKFFSFLIIISGFLVGYLSFFGIETQRFNKLIQEKISKSDGRVTAKIDKVKILLNLSDFSINIKASDVDLMNEDKKIQLENISTNFSLGAFLKKEFGIKNVSIESKDNNLKDVVNFIRIYKNNAQLIIFEKILKKGLINANIELNFGEDGKIKKNYQVKGLVKDAEIRLFNKDVVSNIDFNFDVQKKLYSIKKAKIQYKGIDFLSKEIKIIPAKVSEQYLEIKGDISHKTINLNSEIISIFFKQGLENFENIKLSSDNIFSFLIKKTKIKSYKIDSKIKLDKLNYKIDQAKLKEYIPSFKGSIDFEDHEIKTSIGNDVFIVQGEGNHLIDTQPEKINYKIQVDRKNHNIKLESKININESPLNIDFLNYQKLENKDSSLFIDGNIEEKNFYFKKILFSESKNNFLINNLKLTKGLKINYVDLIDLNFVNNNKQKNKILLKRDKKNYLITGETFDGSKLLEEILTGEDQGGISRFFNNLNSSIKINLDKVFIGDADFLKPLKSDIKFKKNNLTNLNLSGDFVDNKKLKLTIRTNANNEKITTFFAENAKPLVKKYKFIKGFDGGSLDYYSIKSNDLSKSKLKINNFKLKEVPALTKILTLASLQGIADLLTGEGIRFDEFEMDFYSKKKLMTINEIYAIGPAISILMEGYVQGKDLVSLRGTLVPATTINKAIGKIPILGKILVGKKTGEGVFGVSFKIKGPPKKLKTTVNPIKTLTPRFITRTLEKIKKTEVEVKNTP